MVQMLNTALERDMALIQGAAGACGSMSLPSDDLARNVADGAVASKTQTDDGGKFSAVVRSSSIRPAASPAA
jgi:hypothetical protein